MPGRKFCRRCQTFSLPIPEIRPPVVVLVFLQQSRAVLVQVNFLSAYTPKCIDYQRETLRQCRMHTISSQNAGRARVCVRAYTYIQYHSPFSSASAYLHTCTFAHLYISERKTSKFSPPVCAPANQHFCPPAGATGHVRRPRAQNCAIFFARRNALAFSALRPFHEKFPKISPKFLRQKFGVCAKSPYLCTRKSEMRPTTPHKSEAIRSLKTLHKTILQRSTRDKMSTLYIKSCSG